MDLFNDWVKTTGIYNLSWENFVMFGVAFFFMYLAIKKNMESYELLPIGLGVIIANLPLAGMATFDPSTGVHQSSGIFGAPQVTIILSNGANLLKPLYPSP